MFIYIMSMCTLRTYIMFTMIRICKAVYVSFGVFVSMCGPYTSYTHNDIRSVLWCIMCNTCVYMGRGMCPVHTMYFVVDIQTYKPMLWRSVGRSNQWNIGYHRHIVG